MSTHSLIIQQVLLNLTVVFRHPSRTVLRIRSGETVGGLLPFGDPVGDIISRILEAPQGFG